MIVEEGWQKAVEQDSPVERKGRGESARTIEKMTVVQLPVRVL
jgi:hypothetical protein